MTDTPDDKKPAIAPENDAIEEEERDSYSLLDQAYGPDGEQLIDGSGPLFDGESGIRLFCRQGDVRGDVYLSPFRDDARKFSEAHFIEGKAVEVFSPRSLKRLDIIPNLMTEDGGHYYAIYVSLLLGDGELVAINNIWGDARSQVLSEDELLELYWRQQS